MTNPFNEIFDKLEEISKRIDGLYEAKEIPKPEIIDSHEMCKRLNISEPTLAKWRGKKKIPFMTIGKAIRFNWPSVIASIENNNLYTKPRSVSDSNKHPSIFPENDVCACCGQQEPVCGTFGIDRPNAKRICINCQEMLLKRYSGASITEAYFRWENAQGIINVSDKYIAQKLKNRSKGILATKDISPEMIQLARENIKLKREIKNKNNGKDNP